MAWAVAVDDVVPVAERVGTTVSTIARQGLSASTHRPLGGDGGPVSAVFRRPRPGNRGSGRLGRCWRHRVDRGGRGFRSAQGVGERSAATGSTRGWCARGLRGGGQRADPPLARASRRPVPFCAAGEAIRFCIAPDGVRLAWAQHGSGPALVKGRVLAHSSRVRLGEFGMASLARGTRRAAHARSLRRAWMRSFRPRGGGAVARTLGGRPRDGCRRGWLGSVRPARDIPGRGHGHRVQRSASGSRGPAGPRWRLRAGTGPARRPAARAFGRLDLGHPDRVGRPRSDVSAPLHDAVLATGQPGADRLGTTSSSAGRHRPRTRFGCIALAPSWTSVSWRPA